MVAAWKARHRDALLDAYCDTIPALPNVRFLMTEHHHYDYDAMTLVVIFTLTVDDDGF